MRVDLVDVALTRAPFDDTGGTVPIWDAFRNGAKRADMFRDAPVVRPVHESLQAVLCDSTVGLTSLGPHAAHTQPDELTSIPLVDMPPSRLVAAWNTTNGGPLVGSFIRIAVANFR